MWYVVMEGIRLPTPYLTMEEAMEAMNEMRSKMGPACFDLEHD